MQAIITFASGRGWLYGVSSDQRSVFIHQNHVKDQRYLRVDDRVELDIIPSTTHPGKFEARNVVYLGHVVAIQRSAPKAVQHGR